MNFEPTAATVKEWADKENTVEGTLCRCIDCICTAAMRGDYHTHVRVKTEVAVEVRTALHEAGYTTDYHGNDGIWINWHD